MPGHSDDAHAHVDAGREGLRRRDMDTDRGAVDDAGRDSYLDRMCEQRLT